MINQFDFYSIQVSSPRKTDLKKAGVPIDKIRSEKVGMKTYGRGWNSRSFPQFEYVATVGYVDMAGKSVDEASKKADEIAAAWKNKGVRVAVKYWARD